jgi:hypothetical protein
MVKIDKKDDRLTGVMAGDCAGGAILSKPVTFLGGTVLSFNASLGIGPNQESSLNVDIINDCKLLGADDPNHFPDGDHFYGPVRLGGPVFFDTCEASCLPSGSSGCFHFGGILTNYTAQQGGGGLTFNAKVVDPRSLLENAIVIVDSYLNGPIKHRNYFNAYAFYEYNALPTSLKETFPVPAGLTRDPYNTDDVLVTSSGAFNGSIFFPSGQYSKSDCSVFGSADRNERGMTGRKVLQALKNMNPFIYSPNYGESYSPNLTGKDALVAAGKLNHEFNVFQLDMSGFPEPPPYFRVAGPAVSILQLLTDICDITGREFIVTLEKGDPGDPAIIKIETKLIADHIDPEDIKRTIIDFNGKSTELSFGEELRVDKNRTILIGEQEHSIAQSTEVQFFFGEDSNGNPIVPVLDTECGFEIAIGVDKLNAILGCPLFDPDLENANIPIKDKVLKRKVVISEMDIRVALSSNELWKTRVGAAAHPQSKIKTKYPTINSNTIDFNKVIAYNFKDILTTQIYDIINLLQLKASELIEAQKSRVNGFGANAVKGIVDAAHSANQIYVNSLMRNKSKDLDSVYDFISNLGKTYYGKQYLVTLPPGVCAIPAGLYDENYFGVGTGTIEDSYSETYVFPNCSGEITDPNQLNNKIYRDTFYSHIPTNAGGWAEPCDPVLGLHEPELSFFKSEDFRVQPFARFDTKDVKVHYKREFLNPGLISNTAPQSYMFSFEDTYGTNKPPSGNNAIQTTTVIKGTCGVLDIAGLSDDNYIMIRGDSGVCALPTGSMQPPLFSNVSYTGTTLTKITTDIPIQVWVKAEVDEKLYIVSGCIPVSGNVTTSSVDPIPWQTGNPNADCYWPPFLGPPQGYCEEGQPGIVAETSGTTCTRVVKALIKFSDPCLKKDCEGIYNAGVERTISLLLETIGYIVPSGQDRKDDKPVARNISSPNICGVPSGNRLLQELNIQSSLDIASLNNKGFCAAADLPTAVSIPLRSNVTTYGPWYSKNFKTSAGGISFEKDNELAPWNYGSLAIMVKIAKDLVKEAQANLSEIETGSITHPGMPLLSLGFLDNGPNLTNVNVTFGGGGITSNYNFQTYTPRFGALRNLQNQQLKESFKNRQKAQRIIKDKLIQDNKITRKVSSVPNQSSIKPKPKLYDQGTLQRVVMGEIYDFSVLREHNNAASGTIIGSGQRTIVGTDTLEKTSLETRYDYKKKAFMSWDGLLSPVSISGDGDLPMFAVRYTGYENNVKSTTIAPIPPVKVITNDNKTGILDISINQAYLNPLTNSFGVSGHHHVGSGAGHVVDIVGRSSGVPGSGLIMNFYGQQDWKHRYSNDYRFLGLKGPLVLHAWGYDTQGKPIPNSSDNEEDIKNSGIYTVSGLKDQFLSDWLHKPSTWPVAPVDLRFDRERGVWVSPPPYKIVVAQAKETINAYGSGSGILINEHDGNEYGQPIYDSSGNLVAANDEISQANIIIEDRIGTSINTGDKAYAYFDTFTNKYLLLAGGGGGSNIKIGRFMNQWPSLSNVKEPMNAIKDVHIYKPAADCPEMTVNNYTDKNFCPWTLQPVMEANSSGVLVPKTVKVMNIFANVAAAEYQAKWCMFVQIDEYYYLLSAEC